MENERPSLDAWLREAKSAPDAEKCGMYLTHNGVVRKSAKAVVRGTNGCTEDVTGMTFDYDAAAVERAVEAARAMPGIYYVRVWLARGELKVGDDIMFVLIGGDIRPRVVDCLQTLVGTIKNECVREIEAH